MKTRISSIAGASTAALILSLAILTPAHAGKGDAPPIKVEPWVYVGAAEDCGSGYPAGSEIVAAGWVKDFGLPDDKGKDNQGFQLAKNGLTADCSASGAEIKNVAGITLTEIGFDYRNGFHCGAGAPRFNLSTTDGFWFLGGCANGVQTPVAGQPGWTRVRLDLTGVTGTILSLDIVFDEGTDTGPDYTGFATIDNIDINGTLVTKK